MPKTKDWSISELYNQAWEITKNHKVLWVFGAALASLGSFNYSSNFRLPQSFQTTPEKEQLPAKISQVLGTTTEASTPIGQMLNTLFSSIPSYLYVLIGFDLLLALVIWIVLAIIYKAWLDGSLLAGTEFAINQHNVSIKDSSAKSFTVLKRLIWLNIIPVLALFLILLFLTILIATPLILIPGLAAKIVISLFGTILFLAWALLAIFFSMALIFAPRRVIAENLSAYHAFTSSLTIVKHKFFPALIIAVLNTILSAAITFALIAPAIGLLLATGALYFFLPNLIFILALVSIFFLVSFVICSTLLGGIVNGFKASVWTAAYHKIKGKYD